MDRQFLAMKLSQGDIRLELLEHSVDHVVLFHAPWCAHCEQLFPYWEVIASNLYNRQTDVVVGLLDCEVDQDHEELCTELMIEQYPTVIFIGSGEMNQVSNGGIFPTSVGVGKKQNPRVVVYESDLYPHVLYEWIKWMSGISSFQRRMGMFWQGFSTILTATGLYSQMDAVNSRQHAVSSKDSVQSARIAELLASSEALEAQVQQCEVEVDRFKTLEMFDSLKNYGDVFTLLHTEGGSDRLEETHPGSIDEYARSLEMLPLRMCVSDMVTEYCKFDPPQDGTYCALFRNECVESFLEAEKCRPQSCPFQNSRGCSVVSSCMLEDVLSHYADAIQDTLYSIGGVVGTGFTADIEEGAEVSGSESSLEL